jgi:hypothetical protein
MNGFPPNVDLGFISGRQLIQVCVGLHDLILNFDENVRLLVTSCISVSDAQGPDKRFEDFRDAVGEVARALGEKVRSAEAEDDRTLRIEFENGVWMRVFDDSDQFESFVIHGPSGEIIV